MDSHDNVFIGLRVCQYYEGWLLHLKGLDLARYVLCKLSVRASTCSMIDLKLGVRYQSSYAIDGLQ